MSEDNGKGSTPNNMVTLKKHKWTIAFMIVVALSVGLYAGHYWLTKSRFEDSCNKICATHETLCKQLPLMTTIAHKDSVVVIDANTLILIQSGNAQIKNMLEVQHAEIQEDFSSLMLWASVLMVIFLVFSIYSMYRVDDLVNQSRSSVSTIIELSSKAKSRIAEIDTLFKTESQKLATQSSSEIQRLQQEQTRLLGELEQKVGEKISDSEKRIADDVKDFNERVDKKASTVLTQFETIEKSTKPLASLLKLMRDASKDGKGDESNK